MFLGSRSRRGPEPPRDENFEDSERIFKILEGSSMDFHEFSLNIEEFRDLGRNFSPPASPEPMDFFEILLISIEFY